MTLSITTPKHNETQQQKKRDTQHNIMLSKYRNNGEHRKPGYCGAFNKLTLKILKISIA